jgi:hypothetical protein
VGFFEGFTTGRVDMAQAMLHVRCGGDRPPSTGEEAYAEYQRVWPAWAAELRGGGPIESSHHTAEDPPDELAAALIAFLRT